MFRAQICAVLGLGLMLSATSTDAAEMLLSVENRLGGGDNVTRQAQPSPGQRRSDGFWELAPRIILREYRRDELRYDFRYQPSLEKYFTTPEIDGWDHAARGDLDWRITPADSVGLDASLANARQVQEEFVDLGLTSDPALEPNARQRINRRRANAYYSRSFNSALSGRLSYSYDDLDYSRRTVSDSRAHSGSAGVSLALNPLTSVGVTGSIRFRNSKVNQVLPTLPPAPELIAQEIRSESRTVDVSFSIRRQLTKTIDASVQAGPSWIDSDQTVAFVNPVVGTSRSKTNDVSFFTAASLRKSFKKGELSAAYTRYESGGGQTISSAIVDDVTVEAAYRLDRQWDGRLLGGWNRRQQFAGVPGSDDTDINRYRLVGLLNHALTPRLSLQARLDYVYQTQRRPRPGNDPVLQSVTGWIALRYNFEPIVF